MYIQAQSPGPDREANWLPCPPSGPFSVTARVYQPKQTMLDGRTENNLVIQAGTYQIPPIQKASDQPRRAQPAPRRRSGCSPVSPLRRVTRGGYDVRMLPFAQIGPRGS